MNLSMLEFFYIFPTSLFRKILPYPLLFPLFVSSKLTALKSLGITLLNFIGQLQKRRKENLTTEVWWLVLFCFILSLWLVSLSNKIEFLRYKYWHPSGFTPSFKAHWTNGRDWSLSSSRQSETFLHKSSNLRPKAHCVYYPQFLFWWHYSKYVLTEVFKFATC